MVHYILYLVLSIGLIVAAQSSASPWAWSCRDTPTPRCVKERKVVGSLTQMDLEACKLTCGTYGSLLPHPKYAKLANRTSRISPSSITTGAINAPLGVSPLFSEAFMLFRQSLVRYHPDYSIISSTAPVFSEPVQGQNLTVHVNISGADEHLLLSTNESYTLNVTTAGAAVIAIIDAPTFFGARHALETLSQLIDYDEEYNSLQIVLNAFITDQPFFKYRGLIIDTSRNFMSVEQLKSIIDGMSYNKLNSFHWHISDSQTFPLYIPSVPNMTLYGAYSQREFYNPKDITTLVHYAKVRGVRIVPEIDAPAHAAHGWEWGHEAGIGNLAVCVDKQPWDYYCEGPPCGQLNIANPNIYTVISKIYNYIMSAFGPLEMFHYGGDEIILNCWNTTDEVVAWMEAKGLELSADSYYNEWGIFQEKAFQLVTEANNGVPMKGVLWTSELTEATRIEKFLNKTKYIIQVWTTGHDPIIGELLNKGYQIILSNYDKLYLDCGFGSWVADGNNWCSPYNEWQGVYDNDIQAIVNNAVVDKNVDDLILGGEAAIWSEQIDADTMDARLWPRASALAERLWSNPKSNYQAAESRILEQRRRLSLRGLRPSRLQPEWCRQNTGECPKFPAHGHKET